MIPEARLDRLERMAMLLARAGFRARSQLRARDREQDEKINHLINLQISNEERFARNEERFARNEERFARNEERFAKLAESQAGTDRRLNSLIDIIKEDRHGNSDRDNRSGIDI
jgi:hypothetical protein